jgi:Protein of unknown function (DUF2892)
MAAEVIQVSLHRIFVVFDGVSQYATANLKVLGTCCRGPRGSEGAAGLRRQPGAPTAVKGEGSMATRKVNITPAERVGRILLGLVGAVGGILLLAGSPTALAGTLEVLLVLAGLDLVVTGATGHCPLYQKLGHLPASLRRS